MFRSTTVKKSGEESTAKSSQFVLNVIIESPVVLSNEKCDFRKLISASAIPHIFENGRQCINQDFADDISSDVNDLLSEERESGWVHTTPVFYPHTEMSAAAVIDFPKPRTPESEALIGILASAYQGNSRSAGNIQFSKKKITFIFENGSTKHIDFHTDKDYWGLIYAIKRHIDGEENPTFSGNCLFGNASTGKSGPHDEARPGLGGKIGGGFHRLLTGSISTNTNGNNGIAKQNYTEATVGTVCVCALADLKVNVLDHGSAMMEIDLREVQSLAITLNCEVPRDYMLQVTLTGYEVEYGSSDSAMLPVNQLDKYSGNLHLQFAKKSADGSVGVSGGAESMPSLAANSATAPSSGSGPSSLLSSVIKPYKRPSMTSSFAYSDSSATATSLLLPISCNELKDACSTCGISDEGGGSAVPFSVAILSGGQFAGAELAVVAENVIPYMSFFTDSFVGVSARPPQKPPKGNNQSHLTPVKPPKPPSVDHENSTIRLGEAIDMKVALKQLGIRRAVRVYVNQATDLPSCVAGKSVPPSAYCTVYLMDKHRKKLTTNNSESRTDAIVKSFDPSWNKEILLQGLGIDGMGGVDSVLVIVRDSSSGFLKHRHIGQVLIPINCFIYHTEATFCLPLEFTYRMDNSKSNDNLGTISLTTELVTVENNAVDPSAPLLRTLSDSRSLPPPLLENDDEDAEEDSFLSSRSSPIKPQPSLSILPGNGGTVPEIVSIPSVAASVSSVSSTSLTSSSTPVKRMSNAIMSSIHSNHPGGGASRASVRNPANLETHRATLSYSLHRNKALNVWWPFRSMFGGDSFGHVLVAQHALVLKLLPGASGILSHCKELTDLEQGVYVILPWSQIHCTAELTPAVLMMTLEVQNCTTATAGAGSDINYTVAILDILIAPCLATSLQNALQDRLSMWGVRSQLLGLIEDIESAGFASPYFLSAIDIHAGVNLDIEATGATVTQSTDEDISPTSAAAVAAAAVVYAASLAQSPQLIRSRHSTMAASVSRFGSFDGSTTSSFMIPHHHHRGYSYSSPGGLSCKSLLAKARPVLAMLETIIADCKSKISEVGTVNIVNSNVKPLSISGKDIEMQAAVGREVAQNSEQRLASLYRRIYKAYGYISVIMHTCRLLRDADDAPKFELASVQELVDSDCADSQIKTPLRAEADPNSLVHRHDFIFDVALQRLRDVLICGGGLWENFFMTRKSQTVTAMSSASAEGLALRRPSQGASGNKISACIEELLSGYLNALQLSLFPYISDQSAFDRIGGQAMKNCILRLLLNTNSRLGNVVSHILSIYGLKLSPDLSILSPKLLNDVIDWYSVALVKDTRLWLTRTIQNFYTTKTNKFNIPWDVEVIGKRVVSTLPETLQLQLTVYLEMCFEHDQHDATVNKVYERHGIASDIANNKYQSGPDGLVSVSQHINDRIISAIGKSLIMLADEYKRALQCKHWEQGANEKDANGEQHSNLMFLIGVVNDSYRVCTCQIMEQFGSIDTATVKTEDVSRCIVMAFTEVSSMAMNLIVRILFLDLHVIMLNFESYFSGCTAGQSITTELCQQLKDLKCMFEESCFIKLLKPCADVCVLRYLLFFRERAIKNVSFTVTEIEVIRRDLGMIESLFNDLSGSYLVNVADSERSGAVNKSSRHVSHAAHQGLVYAADKSVKFLFDAFELMTLDVDSEIMTESCRAIADKYITAGGEQAKAGAAVLNACGWILRPTTNSTDKSGVNMLTVRAEAQSLISVIIQSAADSGTTARNSMSQTKRPSLGPVAAAIVDTSNDLFVRAFASVNFKASTLTSSGAPACSLDELDDNYQQPTTPTTGPHSGGTFSSMSSPMPSNVSMSANFKNITSFMSPMRTAGGIGGQLKVMRERAADLPITLAASMGAGIPNTAAARRLNEDNNVTVLRALGLVDAAVVESVTSNNYSNGNSSTAGASAMKSVPHNNNDMPDSPDYGEGQDAFDCDNTLKHDLSFAGEDIKSVTSRRSFWDDPSVVSGSEYTGEGSEPPDCLIIVTDLQAKNLKSASFFGGANPYVAVSLGGQRLKTPVKSNVTVAEWTGCVLKFKAVKARLEQMQLTVRVYDKELVRRKRLMGDVSVKLAGLDLRPIVSWFALKGGDVVSTGDVHIHIQLQELVNR